MQRLTDELPGTSLSPSARTVPPASGPAARPAANVLTAVRSDSGKVEEEVDLDEMVVAPLVLGVRRWPCGWLNSDRLRTSENGIRAADSPMITHPTGFTSREKGTSSVKQEWIPQGKIQPICLLFHLKT